MKLKEKLANQITVEIGPESQMDCKRLEIAALAGFEKARELAIRKMIDTPHAIFRLRDLGEEEVE